MASLFSEYRALIRRSNDHPDDPQHDKALDEFKRSLHVRTVSAAQLRPILAKARSRFLDDWWTAMDLLTALAAKNAAVQDALLALSNSKKVHHRFALVACLSPQVPKSLAKNIVRKALDDRASTVRQKAAEAADRLGLEELTADMEQRLAREADPKTKWALQFHVAMLRDGYFLERKEGEPRLTVRTNSGYWDAHVTPQDIERGRVPSIVKRVRQHDPSRKKVKGHLVWGLTF
jgi:hypothetical protein